MGLGGRAEQARANPCQHDGVGGCLVGIGGEGRKNRPVENWEVGGDLGLDSRIGVGISDFFLLAGRVSGKFGEKM